MIESSMPEETEQAAPPNHEEPTVVGIGASAGGLSAIKKFFENAPADSGLIFVVVVHLSPEHKSLLADLLQPHVRMSVQQVTETTPLEPNKVYVIPPNANLSAIDTHLRLSKLEEQRRERAPIDHFFRTLAATHDGHSVGVVLTGTGSDGTLGIREIKSKGGIVIVQEPNEAEFDGMPQSAIATGAVDLILPLADIFPAILRFAQTKPRVAESENMDAAAEEDPLPKVLTILRARTERDFTQYRRSTLVRRIARRMQLNHLEDVGSYLVRLREHPEEPGALADDLLINVTSFFRDPEVFETLSKRIIPGLFEDKSAADSIRVWSVGCATGEEAYSLAMLLVEEAGRRESRPRIQVFASDLHKHSLDKGREGFYPGDIKTDVTAERLKRFFQAENGGYRIRKELRELVIFAPHNLLSDPPFSRLDFVSCRNLLIYLEREIQREVIALFHYALCDNGTLLLGSAEVADAPELFRAQDKKLCLYRKRNVPSLEPRLPVFPFAHGRSGIGNKTDRPGRPRMYGALHERMLEQYAPPSILVNVEDKVVHLSEHAGRYLLPGGGELTASVLKLLREELRVELHALLKAVRKTRLPQDSNPVPVRFNGHARPVVMHIRPPMQLEDEGLVLVMFEEREPLPDKQVLEWAPAPGPKSGLKRIQDLEVELNASGQRLQAAIEEFETSQEEMKASNEEMQSTNEELRSTMEELETSKEELQSINEELQTVNQENRHKVEELSQLSSDLTNLLSATDIATLFLDRELRILRFTPKLGELFNVRLSDRGRPISDLTSRLGYAEMRNDASAVLGRLVPVEREVQDERGRWYLTRVLPYRSLDDRIEGVVITFVDITVRRKAEDAARQSEERLSVELEAMRRLHDIVSQLIVAPDLPTALQDVLDSAVEMTGADMGVIQVVDEADNRLGIVAQHGLSRDAVQQLGSMATNAESVFSRALLSRKRVVVSDLLTHPLDDKHLRTTAEPIYRAVQSTPLISRDGRALGVLSTLRIQPHTPSERDLRLLDLYTQQAAVWVDQRQTAQELLRSREAEQSLERKYHELFESIDQGFCIVEVILNADGTAVDYRFVDTNPAFEKNTGMANARGRTMRELAPTHEPLWLDVCAEITRNGTPERYQAYAEALGRYFDVYAFRTGGPDQRQVAILFSDITERRRHEEQQQLLLNELNHRVKNTLVTVTSIANQTLNTTEVQGDFAEKFRGRLIALSDAHNLLTKSNWAGAELGTMLRVILTADEEGERVSVSGPAVLLPPQTALSLSLIVYELSTNARKYGALSSSTGRLHVSWRVSTRSAAAYLEMDWSESGGPPVQVPGRTGFGRGLIEKSLRGVGGTSILRFDPAGVVCRIEVPLPSALGLWEWRKETV